MPSPSPQVDSSRWRKHEIAHEVFAGISYIVIGVFSALAKDAVPVCYLLFGSATLYFARRRPRRWVGLPGRASTALASGVVEMALPSRMPPRPTNPLPTFNPDFSPSRQNGWRENGTSSSPVAPGGRLAESDGGSVDCKFGQG